MFVLVRKIIAGCLFVCFFWRALDLPINVNPFASEAGDKGTSFLLSLLPRQGLLSYRCRARQLGHGVEGTRIPARVENGKRRRGQNEVVGALQRISRWKVRTDEGIKANAPVLHPAHRTGLESECMNVAVVGAEA